MFFNHCVFFLHKKRNFNCWENYSFKTFFLSLLNAIREQKGNVSIVGWLLGGGHLMFPQKKKKFIPGKFSTGMYRKAKC